MGSPKLYLLPKSLHLKSCLIEKGIYDTVIFPFDGYVSSLVTSLLSMLNPQSKEEFYYQYQVSTMDSHSFPLLPTRAFPEGDYA